MAKAKAKVKGKKDKFFVGAYRDSTKRFRLGIPQKTEQEVKDESKTVRNIWEFIKIVEIDVDAIPEK